MKFFPILVILAVAVVPISGCNTDAPTTEKSHKPFDPSVSQNLAVVSSSFISAEKERARQQSHESMVEFAKSGAGVVYIEPFEDKVRVVHNGQPQKPYFDIGDLTISNDGKRVAYVARPGEKDYKIVVDGREGFVFRENDSHGFSPDGNHHISTVTQGENRYLVIDNKVIKDYRIARNPLISSDSRAIAFSAMSPDNSRKQLIIADMNIQNKTLFDSCGEYYISNEDRSRLSVLCSEGGKNSVKVVDFLTRKLISSSQFHGMMTRLRFSADNRSLSYTFVRNGDQRYVVYNGREEKIPAGDEFFSDPLVLTEPEGVGVIIGTVFKARLYRAFQKKNKIGKGYGYISDFVSSKDGRHHAFIAVNHNEERQYVVVNGHEGMKFDKIVSPVFSPDGLYLVYRARQSGKRFLVVSDMKGKIVRRHQDYDMVFQPVFIAEGTAVAYGVLDGNELWWKVEKL